MPPYDYICDVKVVQTLILWENSLYLLDDPRTLEDEFHFILECPVYSDFRSQYIKKKFWKRPNILKFIELMTSENQAVLQKLACYVHKSFELRNEMLYKRWFY